MREIKFRAWDKDLKEMTTGFGRPQLVIRLSGRVTEGATHPNIELMQFTGLKDKNGKEIYEGDILQYYGFSGNEPETISFLDKRPFLFSVRWDDKKGRFAEQCLHKEDGILQDGSFLYNLNNIIIGNIYENPELLK